MPVNYRVIEQHIRAIEEEALERFGSAPSRECGFWITDQLHKMGIAHGVNVRFIGGKYLYQEAKHERM